jgi:hypothetical protein
MFISATKVSDSGNIPSKENLMIYFFLKSVGLLKNYFE